MLVLWVKGQRLAYMLEELRLTVGWCSHMNGERELRWGKRWG